MRAVKLPQPNMSSPLSLARAVLPADAADASSCASALSMAREAIARWRDAPLPAGALPRDKLRLSPQARWLAQAHAGLSTWIEQGGFGQAEPAHAPADTLPPLASPVMYRLPTNAPASTAARRDRACRLS